MITDLVTPRSGPGVCPRCFNFTREDSGICRACRASGACLDVMVPISYAQAGGSLHRGLADYKRAAEPAVPYLTNELARILSHFLFEHESCLATAAGVAYFDSVVAVPSSDPRRDNSHPLRSIVGERVGETIERYSPVLVASGVTCVPHSFDERRFVVTDPLRGRNLLLIDDVWTTGASAQSAAAVLKRAGAATVAAVVIGRYVNGFWGGIAERLVQLRDEHSFEICARCQSASAPDHWSQAGPVNRDGDPVRGSPSGGI